MVWDVHAAKVASASADVVAIHDVAVGEDVGEHAFRAKLAIALGLSAPMLVKTREGSYLCEVLARRALRQRFVRVQERTGFAGLASSLTVEFARHMGGTCRARQ